ncbi:MAG: hypothetical protein A2X94_17640 [Bdellovibrionales bacterium GWB1_55_8]|nr:MAG: hypothetical protein A2X94_17640 [Bdellovibrionales bacterium GWB1_55_8]
MNSNDDRFDSFLKKNAPRAPEAAAWEKQKIWKEIEARGLVPEQKPALLRMPKWAAAMSAAFMMVVAFGSYRHFEREAEIDRVLYQILQGEFQDQGSDKALF